MNDLELLTLEAFLAALANQVDPLPEAIQQRLQVIAENLEQHVDELDGLAETYQPLETAYQSQRLMLQRQGGQRQKLLIVPLRTGTDHCAPSPINIAKTIFCSDNSVLTTQDFFRMAENHPDEENDECEVATQELLAIPGLLARIKHNQKTPKLEYTSWRTLHADV